MAKELRVIAPIVPAGDFEVANAKDIKAGDKRLDVALAEAAAEVAKKANKTDVNNELNKKASTEYVNAELSKKADITDVAAELVTKANKIDTETALAGKASVEGLESANEAIADLSTEQAALSARMDTFTRLEEGSTTGDAELADGRVGADGKTYENIGGAIRGQVTDLKSDLIQLNSTVGITLNENGYINSTGVVIPGDIHRYYSDFIICNSGAVKYIAESNHINVCGISFYDKNKNFIYGEQNVGEKGTEITTSIPSGAMYCRLSTYDDIKNISTIVFNNAQLPYVIENIYSEIPNVNPIIEKLSSVTGSTRNLWTYGDQAFERKKTIELDTPLGLGTYSFSAIITSTDTSDTTSRVEFSNAAQDKVYAFPLARNEWVSKTVTIDFEATEIIIYAAKTLANSTGDTATFEKIQIEVGNPTNYIPPITAIDYTARSNNVTEIKYVSTLGNDNNDGNSKETAYKTIAKALNQNCRCIFIEHGTYNEKINCSNRDLKIYGDDVTISTISGDAWYFNNCSLDIRGVTIENAVGKYASGFRFYNCTGKITDCKSINSGYMGFRITGSKLTFIRCVANGSRVDGFNGHDFTDENSVIHNAECTFIDCVADGNGDDGCSFHENGKMYIMGGEYCNNVSTGFAPHQRCTASIKNAYIHDNGNGIECINPDADVKKRVETFSNLIVDNTTYGIHAQYYEVLSVNDKFSGNGENTKAETTGTIIQY